MGRMGVGSLRGAVAVLAALLVLHGPRRSSVGAFVPTHAALRGRADKLQLQSQLPSQRQQQHQKRSRQPCGWSSGYTAAAAATKDLSDERENVIATPRNDPEWAFFDTARINVKGGDGGNGCVSFRREKSIARGGPNGGNGARGGSIHLVCDDGLNTLATVRNKVHYKGICGANGQGKGRHAANPGDVYIRVPPGTVVRDMDGRLCGELRERGSVMLVARGGRGGRGNEAFKTHRNNAPKFCEVGEKGGERWLQLELKLVADVGLVGCPNAGKSTLLAAVSNARPKVADYPFTTVTPNLGVWEPPDPADPNAGKGMVIADIPGLLEGAHTGVGLGLAFLRHVQRCRVLVHVVSGSSPDPIGDFRAIQQELELFNPRLLQKPQVVVLNKVDLPDAAERADELVSALKEACGHTRVMPISAMKKNRSSELMLRVRKLVELQPEEDLFDGIEAPIELDPEDEDKSFQVLTDPAYPGQFRISGSYIERIAAMTDWDYYEAVARFQRIMDAVGVNDTLRKEGAKEGDLIMIGEHLDFDFVDKPSSDQLIML